MMPLSRRSQTPRRVKKSGAAGDQMKEAQAINKSLSALGDVISALATDQVRQGCMHQSPHHTLCHSNPQWGSVGSLHVQSLQTSPTIRDLNAMLT